MSKGFRVVMWGGRRRGGDSAHFASLAAIVPECLPWAAAMSVSSADGWREPSGPASVPAPYET